MTPQEIYNKVRDHLLTQNRKSVGINSKLCMYRGADDTRCAAGCLIADEHYSPMLEDKTTRAFVVQSALAASGINVYDYDTSELLRELQGIHDNKEPHQWPAWLKRTAAQYGLTP